MLAALLAGVVAAAVQRTFGARQIRARQYHSWKPIHSDVVLRAGFGVCAFPAYPSQPQTHDDGGFLGIGLDCPRHHPRSLQAHSHPACPHVWQLLSLHPSLDHPPSGPLAREHARWGMLPELDPVAVSRPRWRLETASTRRSVHPHYHELSKGVSFFSASSAVHVWPNLTQLRGQW